MRVLLIALLIGSFTLLTGCKCGKDQEESMAPTETLETAPDRQKAPAEVAPPGNDQMGQEGVPAQPGEIEDNHPNTETESPE